VDFPEDEVVIVVEVVEVLDVFVGTVRIGGIAGFDFLQVGLGGAGAGSLKDLLIAQEKISFPTGTQDPSSLQIKTCSTAQVIALVLRFGIEMVGRGLILGSSPQPIVNT